ncbi:hypothetical protein BVY01_01540 [bacterium I07]|nr:hypothetical protein BVY01_01540 [bacterium I07]
MKLLIIGNSAASVGASEAFRKHDRVSEVTVVSDESFPVYSRCMLSYFLSNRIDESRLLFRPPDFHKDLNIQTVLGERIETVDTDRQQAVSRSDKVFDFDQLLIATGSSPKIPDSIPFDTKGVFVLRTLEDACGIKSYTDKTRNAIILGGGLVGMKAAFALQKRGLHVTVVVRSPHVLSQMIDYEAAQIVMERLAQNGIEVHTGSDIVGVKTRDGKLNSVRLNVELDLPCEMLIVAKGVQSNMGLIRDTAIEQHWGIMTDSTMRTSIENVYAAGDVAETMDIATGERSVNALWTCAIQQGRIAGLNMAGQAKQYDGSVGLNSINFPGVDLISFGVVKVKENSDYETVNVSRPETGIYKKLILKEGKIKGLILVNAIDNAGILLSLLSRKVDVNEFKEELLGDQFGYGKLIGHLGQDAVKQYREA